MPMYDTVCTKCGHEREVRLSAFDSPMPHCEQPEGDDALVTCDGTLERKVGAPAGFVFLGDGTYDKGYVSK